MSMPVSDIYCKKCGYSGAVSVLWGIFKYRFEDGHELNVDRNFGWCMDCGAVVPIERLPESGAVKKELREVQGRLVQLHPGSLLQKLAHFISSERRTEVGKLRERQKDLEHVAAMLKLRTASARCLTCASTSVHSIPITPTNEETYDHPIGMDHPGCGGGLHIRGSDGIRIALRMTKKRIYAPDGKLIAVEEDVR